MTPPANIRRNRIVKASIALIMDTEIFVFILKKRIVKASIALIMDTEIFVFILRMHL
jgi:hypothetical protein